MNQMLIRILAIVGIIVVAATPFVIYFWWKGKIKFSMPSFGGGAGRFPRELGIILIDIAGYLAFLGVVGASNPGTFFWINWEAWWTPTMFFFGTNVALLVCVIAASLTIRRPWAILFGILVMLKIMHHSQKFVYVRTVREEAKIEYMVDSATRAKAVDPLNLEEGFPTSGQGYATDSLPLKVVFDPLSTAYRKNGGGVRFVSVETGMEYIDTLTTVHTNFLDTEFDGGATGKCLAYPYGAKKIWLKWVN